MRQPRRSNGSINELSRGILFAVAWRFVRATGRKGMHAIHHARLFEGIPKRFVLGLHRVVTHGVHRANQADAAALGRYAIHLGHGEAHVLNREQGGEIKSVGVLEGVLIGPFIVRLAKGARAQGVLMPWISMSRRRALGSYEPV